MGADSGLDSLPSVASGTGFSAEEGSSSLGDASCWEEFNFAGINGFRLGGADVGRFEPLPGSNFAGLYATRSPFASRRKIP